MDEARQAALHFAVEAMKGAAFTEVVRAAEAFHAFLVKGEPKVSGSGIVGQIIGDLSAFDANMPTYDRPDPAQADQSPATADPRFDMHRLKELAPTYGELQSATVSGVTYEFYDDDAKTRLVSRETQT